ncbi:MAG: hypothetical protein J0I65_20615 [Variovorax sp.]|nr:hypothetical protein [Variovorax sp.]
MAVTVYHELANSTYLDLTSYRGNAPLPTPTSLNESFSFNVALVMERANDPTALLEADWGARQAQLETLKSNNTLWSTYGADPTAYQEVRTELTNLGFTLFPEGNNQQYVSSPESRTIWLKVDQDNFHTLFGNFLHRGKDEQGNDVTFWLDNLNLPDTLTSRGVKGVFFDTNDFAQLLAADPGATGVVLPQGAQSPGNSVPQVDQINPNDLAVIYNYPFNSDTTKELWKTVETATIGLVEPNYGTKLPADSKGTFEALTNEYRKNVADLHEPGTYIGWQPGGAANDSSGERALDVGVVATVSPKSKTVLYAGSGDTEGAMSLAFTAYQAAIWDDTNQPHVISSSWHDFGNVAPDSPFAFVQQELYIDAVLRNITMVNAVGDGGSGDEYANGLTNIEGMHSSPYAIVSGGTSLSSLKIATGDPTLQGIVAAATAGNLSAIWQLVAGGLKTIPSAADPQATDRLIETVWNTYVVDGTNIVARNISDGGYFDNNTGGGGVDPSKPQPAYQTEFGLDLATSDPSALPGRGVPDVAALAGGNTRYVVPGADMTGTGSGAGTSATSPMWAALVAQFDAIFRDQGLSDLGYMNDLLYIAAAIAPGSFGDITIGNNTSSFALDGTYTTPQGNILAFVTPTGYGYEAGPGYDLTTGLGTPNGVLLARALTAIAHEQVSFGSVHHIVDVGASGDLTTTLSESLLVQTSSTAATTVEVLAGGDTQSFSSGPSAAYAWTSLFAQQSLQSNFSPDLVRLFDKQAQGTLGQVQTATGDALAVSVDGVDAGTPQVTMTSPFGFVDFASDGGGVRVARPVAVAETAGGANDQQAVVRVRQNGEDSLSLTFYRVDDFNGAINGLQPGEAGYAAAAQGRAYQVVSGSTTGTSLAGPGYGNYTQAMLQGVDAGDYVAMTLTNVSSGNTFWAFAQANESPSGQPTGHIWNYGLNTWGWEDQRGLGDNDFNDLVVQLDFTSASGSGWLV